jgi:hypothetical protein
MSPRPGLLQPAQAERGICILAAVQSLDLSCGIRQELASRQRDPVTNILDDCPGNWKQLGEQHT